MLILAIGRGLIRACVSEPVLAEYHDVLFRPKFARFADDLEPLLQMMLQGAIQVDAGPSGFTSPDPDDTKFIDCAVAGDASFLVTGNLKHFPVSVVGATKVVSSRDLLEHLETA